VKLLVDMNLSPNWVDDLDFSAILAATQGTKPSVVQIRSDNLSSALIGDPIIAAIRQMAPELAAGALLTVDPGRTRLNLLPLRSSNA
jgi:predicted nuclease of predicted toxin-antitoxin system